MYAIIKYIFDIHRYYNTLLYIRTSKNKKRVSQIKICGIICEYNPLHNGHIYQLQYARKKSDFVVCIMSGHFVQRGECAVFDKFSRAKAALLSGADAVFELPTVFAVQAAEYFALGGVLTAQELGCTQLCFGSESGDLAVLRARAQAPLPAQLKTRLKNGFSYGQALSSSNEQLLPNNMLGIEYLKAINKIGSTLIPLTLQRKTGFSSAQALRSALRNGADTEQMYPFTAKPLFWEQFFELIKYRILSASTEELSNICGVSEGLEYKIKKECLAAQSLDELILRIKSKRYPYSRISRILCCALLNITKPLLSALLSEPPKVRLLGIKKEKLALLSLLTNYYSSPSAIKDPITASSAAFDQYATQIYSLFSSLSGTEDFTLPFLKI